MIELNSIYIQEEEGDVGGAIPHLPQERYTRAKRSVFVYRVIFVLLGALYLAMAGILSTKSLSWSCGLLLGNCLMIKCFLCYFCLLTASLFIGIALMIKQEKEIAWQTARPFIKKLKGAFEEKRKACCFGEEESALKELYKRYSSEIEKRTERLHRALLAIRHDPASSGWEKERVSNKVLCDFYQESKFLLDTSLTFK